MVDETTLPGVETEPIVGETDAVWTALVGRPEPVVRFAIAIHREPTARETLLAEHDVDATIASPAALVDPFGVQLAP